MTQRTRKVVAWVLLAPRLLAFIALVVLFVIFSVEGPAFAAGGDGDGGNASAALTDRPSIVIILTDDQRWDMLHYMPQAKQDLQVPGVTFANAFVSNSLCCPSRASILTGNYSHTTGVYTNTPPHGGWDAFHDGGAETSTLATWLHDDGYHTALIGKYMNSYGPRNLFVPPGWDRWVAFDELNGRYYQYDLNVDGVDVHYGTKPADYSTDVIAKYARSEINSTPFDQPLFLFVSTFAPHGPPTPAPRDVGTIGKGPNRWPPNFNEQNMHDKPKYLRDLPMVNASNESKRWRHTAESLGAVDDAVHTIVRALDRTGRLSNTMIVFTSDNGLTFGEHRWTNKLTPYEESIRVPLLIRYDPLIPPRSVDGHLVTNLDLAPTIAQLAGAPAPAMEGAALEPLFSDPGSSWRSEFLLEHLTDGRGKPNPPTYCGVRSRDRVFIHYASGFEEYYRLRKDPYQLQNAAYDRSARRSVRRLRRTTRAMCVPRPPGMPAF
jgi:N-acetylglucosamine-6-sulfatase